jgi:ParB family chromosome partitioning protein
LSEQGQAEGKVKKPKFMYLDIDQITVPNIRVTSDMPEDLQEQFQSTVKEYGVVNPVKIAYSNNQYVLVDGLHRLQELIKLGEKKAPAIVVEMPLRQALLENMISGKLQGRGRATDMIRLIKYLVEEEKMTVEEIAAKSGYKARYLYDLLSIANANPDLLEALDKEQITLGHAIELARIPDDNALLRTLYNVIYRRMTVRDTKELVDAILEQLNAKKSEQEQPRQPPPRDLIPVQCWVCGEEAPARNMATFLLCPKCQAVLFEFKAEYRAEKLRQEKARQQKQPPTQTSTEPQTEAAETQESQNQTQTTTPATSTE